MHDILADVLTTLQLQSSVYCQSTIQTDDWALQFQPSQRAVFHIIAEGACYLLGEPSRRLTAGDLLVLPQGPAHWLGKTPQSTPCATIALDQQVQHCINMRWNGAAPPTTLVCGTFQFTVAAQSMLLTLLPSQLYFAAAATHTNGLQPLMAALVDEANAERQGKNTMLNRLADILFVQIIRAWLIDPHSTVKGWLAGLRDAQISQALSAFHALPEKNWTVAALAWQANMSRSAFAARFTDLMGIAPIQYVLSWRMQLAQRLLRQQELSLAQIALQIGYDSDTAFSKAFKREQGISPAAYRRAVRSQFD